MLQSKNFNLVVVAVLAFLSGVIIRLVNVELGQQLGILFALVELFFVFRWFVFDAREQDYPRTALLNVGVVACGIIVLPYYFFRSRGLRGGLLYTFLFLVADVSWYLAYGAGVYSMGGLGWAAQ